MFHKEGSSIGSVNSSNVTAPSSTTGSGGGKGKGGGGGGGGNKKNSSAQQQQQSKNNKVTTRMDVPLRKSDRRQLLQRMIQFFEIGNDQTIVQPILSSAIVQNGTTISLRTIPLAQGHGKMNLYIRSPTTTSTSTPTAVDSKDDDDNDNTTSSSSTTFTWPYHSSSQVIWMRLDAKGNNSTKNNKGGGGGGDQVIVDWETPTVALWAILTSVLSPTRIRTIYSVIIPTDASKYLCRGADLMKPGMRSLPSTVENINNNDTTTTPSNTTTTTNDDDDTSLLYQKSLQPQRQRRRSMVAICTMENPQPFAVGRLHEDLIPINNNEITMTGIGVYIWNCYGDDIWRHQLPKSIGSGNFGTTSSSTSSSSGGLLTLDLGHYGNPGFVDGKFVYPVSTTTTTAAATDRDHFDKEENDNDINSAGGTEEEDPTTSMVEEAAVSSPEASDGIEDDSAATAPDTESQVAATTTTAAAAETEEEKQAEPSPDEILHIAVCQALLQLSLKRDLPMKVATFYANHVLPNRPPNTTIQLKQTKYKKFNVYLSEQVERGLIQVGPDPTASKKNIPPLKGGGNNKKKNPSSAPMDVMDCLIGFNPRHDDLRELKQQQQQQQQQDGTSSLSTTNDALSKKSINKKLVLVTLYMIPTQWISLLRLDTDEVKATNATSEERKGTGMLTATEARRILENYILREDIVNPIRPDQVKLDGPLTDALYSKGKKKKKTEEDNTDSSKPPEVIFRKDMVQLWMEQLLPAYAMVEMPGSIMKQIHAGIPPKVEIEVVKRQSKKFMTRIRGLEEYGIDPVVFSKDVARRFASSVTVEANPELNGRAAIKKKGYVELVLQGNLVDELEALLYKDDTLSSHGGASQSDYSIPKGVIDVILRKGVPPRKKKGGGSGGGGKGK